MGHSRPNTSHGDCPPLPLSCHTFRPPSPEKRTVASSTKHETPQKPPGHRAFSLHVPKSLPISHSKLNGIANNTPSRTRRNDKGLSSEQENVGLEEKSSFPNVRGTKRLAARASKPRQAIKTTFTDPRVDENEGATTADLVQSHVAISKPINSREHRRERLQHFPLGGPTSEKSTPPKSSIALRETIAKAKAARRNVSKSDEKGVPAIDDEFSEMQLGGSNKMALSKRVASARSNGRLNIAAMGLRELPTEILHMYNTNTLEFHDGSWAESVDLVKLVAADNEISSLGDEFFPCHVSGEIHSNEDDQSNTNLRALESIDLHGNVLAGSLPAGMAHLDYLTTLNLSRNRLENEALDVIAKIKSLRELRVSENLLRGTVDTAIFKLKRLEILDLSKNAITTMPPEIGCLSALQILELSGNRLSSLPLEAMYTMPLREILVQRNALKGCLIPATKEEMKALKSLDVSFNALTSIIDSQSMNMPALQSLIVSENRLRSLPDLSQSTSLVNLTAEGNQIASIPDGLTTLPCLKNVDFSRNDIRQLDNQIGFMDNLSVLRIANNPLRERRLLNLNTEDLKRELKNRQNRANDLEADGEIADSDGPPANVGQQAAPKLWSVNAGGIVDRSSTKLRVLEPNDLEQLLEGHLVKALILHHNLLDAIPQTVESVASTLVTLDISRNKMGGTTYLNSCLVLPKLKTLNLAANAISSLDLILSSLSAPLLSEINVSRNRLAALPVLRSSFPSLTSVFAADNVIADLPFESVRGLHVLDVSGNEISSLEPKIGLLGQESLRTLLVGANRFRVPRRDVVERGTESILMFLRSRIPDEV